MQPVRDSAEILHLNHGTQFNKSDLHLKHCTFQKTDFLPET